MKRILTLSLLTVGLAAVFSGAKPAPSVAAPPAQAAYTFKNVVVKGGGFVTGIVPSPTIPGLMYTRTDVGGAYRWDGTAKTWIPLVDWIGIPDANLFGIESIALDPSNPHRVYLAAGTYVQSWAPNGAILRSDDEGRTFKRFDLPIKLGANEDGRSSGERLAVDPNDAQILYFGSRNDGLWRSRDSGATWPKSRVFPLPGKTDGCGVDFVVFRKSSGAAGGATKTIYVGVSTKQTSFYRSTDAGATWEPVPGAPVGLMPNHAAFDSGGAMYLTFGDQPGPNGMGDGAVWKYVPKTGIWTDITPSPTHPADKSSFGYGGLAVDPRHPGTLVVSTMDRWNPGDDLFRTIDGGAHWTAISPLAVLDPSSAPWIAGHEAVVRPIGHWMGAVALSPTNPDEVCYGTGAGIWGTSDIKNADLGKPTHWTFMADGFEETVPLRLVSPPAGAHLLSALADIGTYTHFDLDASPLAGAATNPSMGSTDGLDFAGRAPKIIARVGSSWTASEPGGVSTDGGVTWTPFASPMDGAKAGSIAVTADGSALIWTPEHKAPLISRDLGKTWAACAGAPPGMEVTSDKVDPARCYGYDGSAGTVYVSSDGGASFAASASGLPMSGRGLTAVFGIVGDTWLVADDQLYHSTDFGANFSKMQNLDASYSVGFGMAAPGRTYPAIYMAGRIGGEAGVFRSDDAGAAWVRVTDDAHQYGWIGPVTGDPRIYGRVYFGTGGRGVIYGDRK